MTRRETVLLRWQNDNQYFTIRVYHDLMGDLILTQSWGDCSSDDSEFTHTLLSSFEEAETIVAKWRLILLRRGFYELPSEAS